MITNHLVKVLLLTAALLPSAGSLALHGRELHINGEFRGTSDGLRIVPGWTVAQEGGTVRILPDSRPNEFLLEIRALPDRFQTVYSDLHVITGNTITLRGEMHGTGRGTIGYEAFDHTARTMLCTEKKTFTIPSEGMRFEHVFPMVSYQPRYIRVRLSAEHNSTVLFRNVQAEIKTMTALPPPPPPAPAPVTVASVPPPPAVVTAPAPPPVIHALRPNHFYDWNMLGPVTYLQVQLPRGAAMSFRLQEFSSRRLYWTVTGHDPRICGAKLLHERESRHPRREMSAVMLRAMHHGRTDLVLVCGPKKVIIHIRVH